QKLEYTECTKGGYHQGEKLNYVLLSSTQKEDLLGCALCAEENPQKKQEWKPLKIVLSQILKKLSKQKSREPINIDEITSELEAQEKNTKAQIENIQQNFQKVISQFQEHQAMFFSKIKDQILTQGQQNENTINELLNNIYDFESKEDLFRNSLLRLINIFPQSEFEESENNDENDNPCSFLNTDSLKNNISFQIKDFSKQLEKYQKDFDALNQVQNTQVQQQIQNIDVLLKFQFSQTLKHPQITTINKNSVKSTGTSPNYRFALIEPEFPSNKVTKIALRIKQGNAANNNWLAIGVCLKNVIHAKNYGFQFNQLGHGAYMISSNAGSWSSSQVQANNCIKSFAFAKNDVVIIEYDPLEKIVKFYKENKPESRYKLEVLNVENEPVCACVLFYYLQDEVEYLYNYKFQQ
ncbi:hypothetical protein IMG5_061110, partial [Ichthyophthirius multifiliis]